MNSRAISFIFLGLLTLLALPHAQDEVFQISYGDTVSDGVPGPGAGNIESGGSQDAYEFEGSANDDVIIDSLVGSSGQFRWLLEAPDGAVLFDSFNVDRRIILPQTGTYTLSVRGSNASTTGVYSFSLLLVPVPQEFSISIGDTVSDGVPAAGAGNLETPGAADVYTFDAQAGDEVIFDWLSGSNVLIGWRLEAPDKTILFDTFLKDRQEQLPQTGTYTLTLRGNGVDDTGPYSFRLLGVPSSADVFSISIGDTVSDGVPGPGAGNLEAPGATDVYTFDGAAGDRVEFDWLSGSNVLIGWRLQAPDSAVLFDTFLQDRQEVLPQTGTYTLIVRGNSPDDFGAYSFTTRLGGPVVYLPVTAGKS
ncbi:MAG: hypothetical protein ACK2UK_17935 [Candidatus Promineifilaceae bacterium]